jgi:hypothetical protein
MTKKDFYQEWEIGSKLSNLQTLQVKDEKSCLSQLTPKEHIPE